MKQFIDRSHLSQFDFHFNLTMNSVQSQIPMVVAHQMARYCMNDLQLKLKRNLYVENHCLQALHFGFALSRLVD